MYLVIEFSLYLALDPPCPGPRKLREVINSLKKSRSGDRSAQRKKLFRMNGHVEAQEALALNGP